MSTVVKESDTPGQSVLAPPRICSAVRAKSWASGPTATRAAFSAIVAFAFTCTGCVDRLMTINSDPPGALVYLNDQEVGRTPLTRDFQQYGNYEVEVRKDGYETIRTNQQTQEPWWQLIPIDLITALAPTRYLDERFYSYTLKPASTQPADADQMLSSAAKYRAMLTSSPNTRVPTTGPNAAH